MKTKIYISYYHNENYLKIFRTLADCICLVNVSHTDPAATTTIILWGQKALLLKISEDRYLRPKQNKTPTP